ncbi:MAG: HAMP domain-containing sensor histidine kinase [Myxococcota bacterium]
MAGTEMAASVAHSINNPLGALLGTAHMSLEADPEDPAMKRILRLATRVKSVVNRTLQLFRENTLELKPVCPQDVIRAVADEQGSRCAEHRIELELRVDEGLPPLVADRALLITVLTSLAENGIDVMPTGGTLRLGIEAVPGLLGVAFRVSDTGGGIPDDIRNQIFEPFFTTKGTGAGLGLAIAQGIVRGHEGRIRIYPGPDCGTEVSVEIPEKPGGLSSRPFLAAGEAE